MRNHEARLEKLERPRSDPSVEAYILALIRGGTPMEAETYLRGLGRNLEELVLESMGAL